MAYAYRMTILSISAAALAAGLDRRTLQRAIKAGRISATVDAAGERGIDIAELIRVFGPLRVTPQSTPHLAAAAVAQDAPGDAAGVALVEALRDQVRQAQEQLRQANEREARLLSLLEAEQQARRALLPAPSPVPSGIRRPWILLVLLLAALALAGWWWREMIISLVSP